MEPLDELRHIQNGPQPDEKAEGWTRRAIAVCEGDAEVVRKRCAEVMSTVVTAGPKPRSVDEWASILPGWFVASCAPEQTRDQAEEALRRWRELSEAQKRGHARNETWKLSGWTHWFTAEDRWWYWWDSRVVDANRLELIVEMPDVQAGLDTLGWLLRAAGAREVDFE